MTEALSVFTLIAAAIGILVTAISFVAVEKIKKDVRAKRYVAVAAVLVVVGMASASLLSGWLSAQAGDDIRDVAVGDQLPAPAAERITTLEAISQLLDVHRSVVSTTTQAYELSFPAREGFRVVKAELITTSATRVSDLQITIAPDGERAVMRFLLTSGPAVDRYRGWLKGELKLTQERARPATGNAL